MAGHYIDIPLAPDRLKAEGSLGKVIVLRPGDRAEDLSIEALALSDVSITVIVMPGVDADMTITLDLTGEGAKVRLAGLYICGSGEKVNIRTVVRHRVPSCTSDQYFTGIAGGQSRVSFNGTIVVAPDAQKTEAYQQSRNILLSQEAKVSTEPQLEIYADDVKCSHGATVGSLNEDEQFYMRSRGIPLQEAKVLQIISFIAPVLASVPEREALASELEAAIRSII